MAKRNSVTMNEYLELESKVSNLELALQRINSLSVMAYNYIEEFPYEDDKSEAIFHSIHLTAIRAMQD